MNRGDAGLFSDTLERKGYPVRLTPDVLSLYHGDRSASQIPIIDSTTK